MGTWHVYRCNKCNYEVQTSGGHDCGFFAVTDTYICNSCKAVVDVAVGEYGITYSKEEALMQKERSLIEMDFYICPDCGSDKYLIEWDQKIKPCPKCGETMSIDANGGMAMWD